MRILKYFAAVAGFAAAALSLASVRAPAEAQPFPSRPITIMVGFAPGGGVDIVARTLGAQLQEQLGQPVIIENRPGANSNLAAIATARAKPDGYTLMLGANGITANMALYAAPGFDVEKDLAGISSVGQIPNVIAAGKGFAGQSLADLVASAKAEPGKITFGTAGAGSSPHLTMELFQREAGITLQHVGYRGGQPAITDTIGGHIALVAVNALEALPQVKGGALRALAVTGKARHPSLPDVPTVAEQGFPGFESFTWWALFATAGTPADVIDKLNAETRKALASASFREKISQVGGIVTGSSPAELNAFITADRAKWTKIIREGKITAE